MTDIVDRLRALSAVHVLHGVEGDAPRLSHLGAILSEAADNIEFLRKQSRGHFEAMSIVLRDGVEALLPETPPKKAN